MEVPRWGLSNRELATASWLAVAAILAVWTPAVRASLSSLIRTAGNWKLLTPVALFAGWTGGVVAALAKAGIWTTDLTKDTVTWFVLSGLVLLFAGMGRSAQDRGFWHRLVWDQIKVTVVFEWITSTYTLGLGAELILLPLLFVLATMDALAGTKPEFKTVGRITSILMAAFGFYVFGSALGEAAALFKIDDLGKDVRAIVLGPILSVATLPLAYFFAVIAAVEMLAVRVSWSIGRDGDKRLARYALWQIAVRCRFSPRKIAQFTRIYLHRMHGSTTQREIDEVISLSKSGKRGRHLHADASEA